MPGNFAVLGGTPSLYTKFPIEESEDRFRQACGSAQRALKTIGLPSAIAIIEGVQPFRTSTPLLRKGGGLAVLKRLSNNDKHSLLNLAFVASRAMGVDAEAWDDRLHFGKYDDGAVVAEFAYQNLLWGAQGSWRPVG